MTRTVTAYSPADLPADVAQHDLVHPAGDDRRWRESYYFSFYDTRHGIGGFSSIGRRVATGHSGSVNVLWGPDRHSLVASEWDSFDKLENHTHVAGMTYSSQQPFGDWRLEFDGKLNDGGDGVECDHAALGPVAKSAADSVDVSYDLTFTPTHPPYVYREDSRWSELFTGHVDEVGLVTGTITIDGTTIEIDGRGGKDHSWGVRNWFAPDDWRWIDLVSDTGPEVAMWRADLGGWIGDGAVFTDPAAGDERAIVGYTETVRTAPRPDVPGKPIPTGLSAEITTGSGVHQLEGTVVRVLPVLFDRRSDGTLQRSWNDRSLLSTKVDGHPGWANVEFAGRVENP
ncbi:MAG: hypothetical protein J0I34_10265 [Pseudonocardia sp.]|uniref:DUF7065 domain-containing protein n=1 Tax=unclassified Pseudonocardia TaxID=2619320 RepID=UPI00086EE820|nr:MULTISPECIES: hypothetical protein [unclassified Pseudonocardia]MBN9109158.1 hypothetical protein [Pseudonocardia sp.]ODV01455.1 MAG: hypothetical protein ABT15_27315 [Pseudonocardia sp. SCN 73-27]